MRSISREQLVGGWVAAVIVAMALSVIAGGDITVSNAALWLIAVMVPPGVTLLLWHGAEPLTVRQLMASADSTPWDGRA